tara:strand:- start:60462 stop:60620 length:159 start_codon:yes stop_codon:yes gene_type:complete
MKSFKEYLNENKLLAISNDGQKVYIDKKYKKEYEEDGWEVKELEISPQKIGY